MCAKQVARQWWCQNYRCLQVTCDATNTMQQLYRYSQTPVFMLAILRVSTQVGVTAALAQIKIIWLTGKLKAPLSLMA